jgi:cohesin loading factor subunit SCC2
MRILSGGREDRQLYSESVIEKTVKAFQKAADEVIIPLVELRNSGPSASIFKLLAKHKKDISVIFVNCQKLLSLLAELVAKVQLSELSLNTLEFVASNLIFVDNAYYEKDSLVGVQKFDGIRSAAMDTLCQIFLVKPEQRQGILNEILTSLSKLPGSKQSSKQYKLSDGGSIQPVSALIMRLVQASSARPARDTREGRDAESRAEDELGEDEDADELQMKPKKVAAASSINAESRGAEQPDVAVQELGMLIQPPMEDAQRNAVMVINFLVQRAVGSSRSGETPFRNILDHCVDDFTVCLESIDWPSAELLLRCLMTQMVHLFEGDRTPAPTKNMALEILGNMSAAISRLCSQVKRTANSSEGSNTDELSHFLSDLANQSLDREVQTAQVVAWTGPYRVALEFLESQASTDTHLASASAYLMNVWSSRVRSCFEANAEHSPESDAELGRLAYRLRMMVEDRTWLSSQFEFNAVSQHQAKLSYAIVLLGSPLCESFERIFSMLLSSMSSDQATVRSKSLKSVNTVLETDPSILDRNPMIIDRILECARDLSSLVREATLGLMGNCIQMRPKLESSFTPHIMERVSDSGVSVRRRAMKLARDIYLRNRDRTLRSHIASGLLRRVISDLDEGVRETARQMVEEIWFAPFYQMDDSAIFQTSLAEHTVLIIGTVKAGGVSEMLDKVLQSVLKTEKKGANGPFDVCAKLVFNLFGYINNPESEDPTTPSGRDALHVLTIFARAEPQLFTFEQMRLLKPHLSSETAEEMATFRAVVVILTCVLPQLSAVHTEFITELKNTLLPKMGKMDQRLILQDLAACIRVVLDLLGTLGPVVSLAKSVLMGVQKLHPPHRVQGVEIRKLRLFSWLLGVIAQNFNLDSQIDIFKATFRDFKGDTVARLMIDKLTPFASSKQDAEIRRTAVEGMAAVCQAWPRNYTLPKVWTIFQQAFQDEDQRLENIILQSFKEFLLTEERRSEASSKAEGAEKKSLTVMGGTSYDDVASATTQRFLKDITRISLSTQDAHALTALEVLASINRQGLTHPKETGVTLITLETSANPKIAELAFQEHRALHEKHETTIEREYTKAVQSAYEYQRDVVKDTRGATVDPPQAKLHNMLDVLKISKVKNKQRFFEKLVALLEFDFNSLDVDQDPQPHLDFCRFVVENIAAFEYQAVGELQTVVHKMEQLVTSIGTSVAQAMDTEIFNVNVDVNMDAQIQQQLNGDEPHGQPPELPASLHPHRFRQLASAAIILILVWETRTYLRRLYGMGAHRHDSKAKALAKDLNKAPTKTQGIHWDKFWEEISVVPSGLQSTEGMMQRCKALVELMNVDKDVTVADGDDDMDAEGPSTPSEDDEDGQAERGRKRKHASTPSGRKKRPRSSSQPRKRGRPRKNPQPTDEDAESEEEWI